MSEKRAEYWREKLSELKVVIIIPTYNNAHTLASVIQDVLVYAKNLIVVNDGSTDNTKEILNTFRTIKIIEHEKNKGKGAALKNGWVEAKKLGFRYAITIDSDEQHFASDIPKFIQAIEETPDALLVGARNLNSENMPEKNSFANKFSNFWYKLETGIPLTDTQSGYRLYPIQKFNVEKLYYTSKYEFELEVLVFAAWKGLIVRNIPIQVYYAPTEERVSHFKPLRDFSRISALNTILVLICFLWIWPRNFYRNLSWKNIKHFFREQILESKDSNKKICFAVMLGVFIGILPIWGYQMLLTLLLSHLFKLNKVIAIVAANISIPPFIPFILYASYHTGCIVLGESVDLSFSEISFESMKVLVKQYLVGSVVFASVFSTTVGFMLMLILSFFRKEKNL